MATTEATLTQGCHPATRNLLPRSSQAPLPLCLLSATNLVLSLICGAGAAYALPITQANQHNTVDNSSYNQYGLISQYANPYGQPTNMDRLRETYQNGRPSYSNRRENECMANGMNYNPARDSCEGRLGQ